MKRLGILLAILLSIFVGWAIRGNVEAQTIGIEPVVTLKIVGTAPVTGLAGLRIQAEAPGGVTVNCSLQQRAVEECLSPSVSQYAFTDEGDLIQSSDSIDGLGVFQFSGLPGTHDVIFTVLSADDDAGNPITYSTIVTQITIP